MTQAGRGHMLALGLSSQGCGAAPHCHRIAENFISKARHSQATPKPLVENSTDRAIRCSRALHA